MNNPAGQLERTPSPFKINTEDAKLIEECNREAFFSRCLPISTALSGFTFMACKAGYLKSHASLGPTPKVIGAAFLGYFIGKISYQNICAEKLMANPNSQLGATLRGRRQQGKGGFQDVLTLDMPGFSLPESSATEIYRDDPTPATFTDLDTDRPYNHGLNDSFRLNLDSPQRPEDFVLPPQATTPNSYDELRRKNREEYENRSRYGYKAPEESRPYQQPRSPTPSGPSVANEPFDRYRSTNVYGDIFDK